MRRPGLHARLFAFELGHQLRGGVFWGAVALFLLLGAGMSRLSLGGEGVVPGGPWSVTLNLGLLSLLAVFAVTPLVARAALRDRESGMEELVRTTPHGRRALSLHLAGGALVAVVLLLAVPVLAMAAVPMLTGAGAAVGPPALLRAFAFLVVPNALFLVAVQLLVAAISRRALAVYLAGVGIYIGYFGLSVAVGSPLIAGAGAEVTLPGALLDPFGIVPFLEATRSWSVEAMNGRPVPLEGVLLQNRILWLAVAAVVGGWAVRLRAAGRPSDDRSRGLHRAVGRLRRVAVRALPAREREGRTGAEETGATLFRPVEVPVAPRRGGGWRHVLSSVLSGARIGLATQLRSVSFAVVAVLWVGLAVSGVREAIADGTPFFDTPNLPLTELVVPALLRPFQLLGALVAIFFAGELAWRHRTAGVHPLEDAAPAGAGARIGGAVLSLAVLSAVLVALLVVPAVGYQFLRGGTPDLAVYGSLFYLLGVPWLVFGTLALGIQNFVSDRYVGTLAAAFVAVLWRPLSVNFLDIDLPGLPFAWAAELDYSVFAGFEPFLAGFSAQVAFWAVVALLISGLARRSWRRGVDPGVRARVGRLLRGRHRLPLRAAAVGGLVFLATGSVVQIATIDEGHLVSEGQAELWRAGYERQLSGLAELPAPTVEEVDLTFDLNPAERRYEVGGSYRLVNETGAPMDSILVGWDRWITIREVSVVGAERVAEYRPYDHVLFALREPLAPGEAARMEFRFEEDESSFGEFDPAHSVVRNGSFVRLERVLPWLGYDRSLELEEAGVREEHGLPPESATPRPRDGESRHDGRARYSLTASTSADQRIAAPGTLVEQWTEGSRSHFRFASDGPMRRRFGIASASWAAETVRAGPAGVELRLLHHPDHATNVPRLAEAGRTSLEVLSELYGPLGRRSVTIAEISSYHAEEVQATSYPGIVFMREHGGYTGDFERRSEGEVDYLWRRVAHELAHQWWGDRLGPARTAPGATVLTETLAEHSAGRVLERRFGPEGGRALRRWESETYFRYRGRVGGEEPPLREVTGETDYVAYFKGPVVLRAVEGLIGRERLDAILREFMARHGFDRDAGDEGGGREPSSPTVDDLYARLADAVSAERRHLLEEWFGGIVTYHLAVEEATVEPLEDGRYALSAEIVLERRGPDAARAADSGSEAGDATRRPAPASEPVTVEVVRAAGADSDGADASSTDPVVERRTLELEPRRRRVRLVLDGAPLRITVDPDVTRIEADRTDNTVALVDDGSVPSAADGPDGGSSGG